MGGFSLVSYGHAVAMPGGPVLRSPNGLATAVTVLLSVVIAADLFAVLADVNMYSLMGRIVSGGAGAVTQAERDRGDALNAVSAAATAPESWSATPASA